MHTVEVRMLRLPEVSRLTGLGRDSIYRLGAANQFPRPYKIGLRASGWRSDAIQAWIESRQLAGAQP